MIKLFKRSGIGTGIKNAYHWTFTTDMAIRSMFSLFCNICKTLPAKQEILQESGYEVVFCDFPK